MFAWSKDRTVSFRVVFLNLSNRRILYPKISPFAKSRVSGFHARTTLVAEVAAGVIFCGLPCGTMKKQTLQW